MLFLLLFLSCRLYCLQAGVALHVKLNECATIQQKKKSRPHWWWLSWAVLRLLLFSQRVLSCCCCSSHHTHVLHTYIHTRLCRCCFLLRPKPPTQPRPSNKTLSPLPPIKPQHPQNSIYELYSDFVMKNPFYEVEQVRETGFCLFVVIGWFCFVGVCWGLLGVQAVCSVVRV